MIALGTRERGALELTHVVRHQLLVPADDPRQVTHARASTVTQRERDPQARAIAQRPRTGCRCLELLNRGQRRAHPLGHGQIQAQQLAGIAIIGHATAALAHTHIRTNVCVLASASCRRRSRISRPARFPSAGEARSQRIRGRGRASTARPITRLATACRKRIAAGPHPHKFVTCSESTRGSDRSMRTPAGRLRPPRARCPRGRAPRGRSQRRGRRGRRRPPSRRKRPRPS
jgi:hypothetical protein